MPTITRCPWDPKGEVVTDWLNVIVAFTPRYSAKSKFINPAEFIRASSEGWIDFLPETDPRIQWVNNRKNLYTVRRQGRVRLIEYDPEKSYRNIQVLSNVDWTDVRIHIDNGAAITRTWFEANRVTEVNSRRV